MVGGRSVALLLLPLLLAVVVVVVLEDPHGQYHEEDAEEGAEFWALLLPLLVLLRMNLTGVKVEVRVRRSSSADWFDGFGLSDRELLRGFSGKSL